MKLGCSGEGTLKQNRDFLYTVHLRRRELLLVIIMKGSERLQGVVVPQRRNASPTTRPDLRNGNAV